MGPHVKSTRKRIIILHTAIHAFQAMVGRVAEATASPWTHPRSARPSTYRMQLEGSVTQLHTVRLATSTSSALITAYTASALHWGRRKKRTHKHAEAHARSSRLRRHCDRACLPVMANRKSLIPNLNVGLSITDLESLSPHHDFTRIP